MKMTVDEKLKQLMANFVKAQKLAEKLQRRIQKIKNG